MNERAGSEREKDETSRGLAEVGGDKVQEWLRGEWGEGSVVKGRGERKEEDKSGEGKGRRGRPTKAESLGRERRDSSASGSIVSHLSKRNRGSDSDSDQEEKEKKKQKVKTEKGNVKFKEKRREKTEGRMEKMEEIMRRLLDETKREIMEKVERTGEEIRRELKKEMKEEIGKIRAEEREEREKLEKELKELKERVQEMEKKNSEQERRERRLNIVIKGVEVKGGNVREVVGGVFEKIGVNEREINVKDAFMIRGKERESMIVVKLNNMYDKRRIMEKKGELRGSRVYVDDDMTKSERDRQREIRMWAKSERDKGRRVKVGFGRGWLNGKEYEWKSERGCMGEVNFQRVLAV